MKKISTLLFIAFLAAATVATAQSESYETLRDRFADEPDVHAFSLGGFLCRTALSLAVPDERSLRDAFREVSYVRLMVIPKAEFRRQKLSVDGFMGVLRKDSFHELVSVRDKDKVTLFLREEGRENRYFLLVEESDEVVAVEMEGYIDPELVKAGFSGEI